MLDILLKLLDNVVKLVGIREKNHQDYFQRYVQPTFELAESVYRDYRLLLRDVRELVQRGGESAMIVRLLKDRREEFLPIRRRIEALVERRVRERGSSQFEAGILAMLTGAVSAVNSGHLLTCEYVPRSRSILPEVRGHTLLDLLEILEHPGGARIVDVPRRLLQAVDQKQYVIEQAWQLVVRGYAELHATTLRPARLSRQGPVTRKSVLASIRINVEKVREMIAIGRFARKPGIELEKMTAAAVPELLQLAMEIRGTTHDLDNREPNVSVADLKQSLARFESALSRIETRNEPSPSSKPKRRKRSL
jgi:hypothetical protein